MAANAERASWLRQHVEAWTAAGLISDSQRASILQFENVPDEPEAPPRLTIVAEVASYLASVIAFTGGAAIIAPNWEALGLFGQGAVALAIAAIGFTIGTWLIGQDEPGTERLGSFLWVVGTGGLALAVAGIVNEIDPRDEAWFPMAIGLTVLVVGVALWRNLDRPLQLVTSGVGFFIALSGIAELVDLSSWIMASALWVPSFVFGVLAALGHVRPRFAALAVASCGAMMGSFLFMEESQRFAAIAAVATAAVIVTYALYVRSWPLVAIGVVAFFIAIASLMATVLESMIARFIAVVLGLIVVAAVAVRAQRSSPTGP